MNGSRSAFLGVLSLAAVAGCSSHDAKGLEAGGVHWQVQTGAWEVQGGALVGSGGQVLSDEEINDGTLEIDVELLQGPGGRTFGIGFRTQPAADTFKGSGYGFNVTTGAATYNVFKGTAGDWRPVNPAFTAFQPSAAIDAKKNHIVVHAKGGSFSVEVNGKPVSSFEDAAYPKGRLSLWVESSGEKVKFSGIKLTH